MSLHYDKKVKRFRDDNGNFVSAARGMRSSVARNEFARARRKSKTRSVTSKRASESEILSRLDKWLSREIAKRTIPVLEKKLPVRRKRAPTPSLPEIEGEGLEQFPVSGFGPPVREAEEARVVREGPEYEESDYNEVYDDSEESDLWFDEFVDEDIQDDEDDYAGEGETK